MAQINNGDLKFKPATNEYGSAYDQFKFKVNDGSDDSAEATIVFDVEPENTFWFSVDSTETGGPTELTDWEPGDAIELGGPNLELGSSTVADGFSSDGELELRFSLEAHGVDLDALHYVSSDITIAGGSGNQFALQTGDLIFSIKEHSQNFGGLTGVNGSDLLVFRPSGSDYSTGTFSMLADLSSSGMSDGDLPFNNTWSISLVESTVDVGGTTLNAGDFLYSQQGGSVHSDIWVMTMTATGENTSAATAYKLIDGGDVGINEKIYGIDIAERDIAIGGKTYSAGTVFLTIDKDEPIAGLNTEIRDVIAINFTSTSVGGTAAATAELVFDHSDTSAVPDGNEFDAFTIVSVNPTTNVAPVLDDAVGFTLPDVAFEDADPAGETVQNIIVSAGGDRITDGNGDPEGIAVTRVDNSNGTWEYSTNAGTSWSSFAADGVSNGSIDLTQTVLLNASALIRFVPGSSFEGAAGDITFVAWDQTTGTNGDTGVDATNTGATSAFSTADGTASITVLPEPNAAPVLDDAVGFTLPDVAFEDADPAGETVQNIIISAGGDRITDGNGDPEGIAVTRVDNSNGTWEYSTNAGTSWSSFAADGVSNGSIDLTQSVVLNASALIRFVPSSSFEGAAGDITFVAWDQTTGTNGDTGVDATNTGATSTFSTADGTASITVLPEPNSAPVLDDSVGFTLPDVAFEDADPAGETVQNIIISAGGDRITDGNGDPEGIAVTRVGNSNGTWEYSTNAGTSWSSFAADGVSNGSIDLTQTVLLNASAQIRFIPGSSFEGVAGDITFVAWDQTTGANGDTGVDATNTGSTSAFSTADGTASITVLPEPNSAPTATADTLGTVSNIAPTTFTIANLLSNDVDADGDTLSLLDFSQPQNGTLVDNGDGTLTYTPNGGFSGDDSFEYTIDDGNFGITNFWSLNADGSDGVGSNNITLNGASFVNGTEGLDFVSGNTESANISGLTYGSSFTVSFRFNISDLNGTGYDYLYSDGNPHDNNSLNVYFREDNAPSAATNTLSTEIRDSNDAIEYYTLDIDASALVGDWHTYTLVVDENDGVEVFIDGVLEASSATLATDTFNLSGNVTLGARSDLAAGRYFDGQLDSLSLIDRAITPTEAADYLTDSSSRSGTVSLTVNTPPTVVADTVSVLENTSVNDSVANDTDINGGALTYSLNADGANGSVSMATNGSFTYTPTADYFGSDSFTYDVTDSFGATSTGTVGITVNESLDISGTILEDLNGDSLLADGVGFAGASIELYLDDGDGFLDAGDSFVTSATTDASGNYLFTNLSVGDYWVIVDSRTLDSSSGYNNVGGELESWAEQTYATAGALQGVGAGATLTANSGTLFGGRNATTSDDAESDFLLGEHVNLVNVVDEEIENIDFGFSFNVVTNVLGGGTEDDDGISNNGRTVQGSLRQFISNANEITGSNEMRFVPIESTNETSANGDWWSLEITEALPNLIDSGTTLDGRAYEPAFTGVSNDIPNGLTLRNENQNLLGYAGVVGIGADGVAGTGDELSLSQLDAPELEIFNGASIGNGITVEASNVSVSYLAIHGFDDANIFVDGTLEVITGTNIHHNILGSSADSFGDSAPAQQAFNISVISADNGTIANNLIGFAGGSSIRLGNKDVGDSTDNWLISANDIRDSGQTEVGHDGIDLVKTSSGSTIVGNRIVDNAGYGIDSWNSTGGHTIRDNTLSGNGHGLSETGGIRLFGTGSTVENNIISDNTGAGVHVIGENSFGTGNTAATGNLISENAFGGNSGLAIDLGSQSSLKLDQQQGDGLSENGVSSDTNAGNDGLDYPELSAAYQDGTGLHIFGSIDTSLGLDRIEFYVASLASTGDTVGGTSYGEGWIFLGSVLVGDLVSLDGATGQFEALIATAAAGTWPTALTTGSVTAIAIDGSNNTSEFGNNQAVNNAPVAQDDGYSMPINGTLTSVLNSNDLLNNDSDDDAGDTLTVTTTPVSGPTNGSLALRSDGTFDFTPSIGFSGTVTFTYEITDGLQTTTADVTILVDNNLPAFQSPTSYSVDENQTAIGTVDATDADGHTISYYLAGGDDETFFNIDETTGELTFKNEPNYENKLDSDALNTYEVTVEAVDSLSGISTQDIVVTVVDINEAPVANIDNIATTVDEGSLYDSMTFSTFDNDGDADAGDTQTGNLLTQTTNGVVTWSTDGTFTYQHDGGETTSDSFTYEVVDSGGLTSTSTVNIVINPVEDGTVSDDDSFDTTAGQRLVIPNSNILANDLDPEGFNSGTTIVIVTDVANGTLVVRANRLIFIPNPGFVGVDTFEYAVLDGGVQGTTATVAINVEAVSLATEEAEEEVETEAETDTSDPSEGVGGQGTENDDDSDIAAAIGNSPTNEVTADTFNREAAPIKFENHEINLQIDHSATYSSSENVRVAELNFQLAMQVYDRSIALSQFDGDLVANVFWDDLDDATRDYFRDLKIGVPALVASTASFLTVGYVAWIIRGGVLLTTFMSSIPAWKTLDITPILESSTLADEDDESIEQMVDSRD